MRPHYVSPAMSTRSFSLPLDTFVWNNSPNQTTSKHHFTWTSQVPDQTTRFEKNWLIKYIYI